MAVSVSKAGPYYTSGEIKFSSLRSNFRSQVRKDSSSQTETFNADNGQITASELRRNIDANNLNPIVPDATENANISSSGNLKLSQFRNSIKYYYVTLPSSDTVTNFDISGQNWNSNLTKNINKFIFIDGVCGSNNPTSPAATFNSTAYNLTIDVYGLIYGAGGAGGTLSSVSGNRGGDALNVTPSSGNNIVVFVRSSANIYGGGGGGEKGLTGQNGSAGVCLNYSQYILRRCRSCPNCNPGDTRLWCFNRQGRCGFYQYRDVGCRHTDYYTVSGGSGGEGGNGAKGRGYDNITNSLSGSLGLAAPYFGGCSGYSANGSPIPTGGSAGENGGNAGDWGDSGSSTNNTGSGGDAGRSISGSNYSVIGSVNIQTIKGAYRPQ